MYHPFPEYRSHELYGFGERRMRKATIYLIWAIVVDE